MNILTIVIVGLVLASCSANTDVPKRKHARRPLLVPASSGNPYEVMVVAEDSMWNGFAGKALWAVLNKDVPMLPQREPMFHVSHILPSQYNRITNIFRNIIILKTNEYTTKPKISYERDKWQSNPDAEGNALDRSRLAPSLVSDEGIIFGSKMT